MDAISEISGHELLELFAAALAESSGIWVPCPYHAEDLVTDSRAIKDD